MPESKPQPRERMFYLCVGENPVCESKLHLFPKAHIVAEKRTRFDHNLGIHVETWAIYNESVSVEPPPLIYPKVVARVVEAERVYCTLCENVNRIGASKSGVTALKDRYGLGREEGAA